MKNIKIAFFIFSAAIFLFTSSAALAQIQPSSVLEMNDKSESAVLKNGDVKVKEVISMSASSYISFKQRYPVLSMFTRIFEPANMPTQIEDLNLNLDEGKNQVVAEYVMKGAAVNYGDHWEIDVSKAAGEKVSLASQNGNTLVFSSMGESEEGTKVTTTTAAVFPKEAKDIYFDENANKVTYKLSKNIFEKKNIFLVLGIVFLILSLGIYFLSKILRMRKNNF
jgi:hypothetical protein